MAWHTVREGLRVRSKNEVVICLLLDDGQITFRYEQPLQATRIEESVREIRPDFTIYHHDEIYYWEHLGMLDLQEYREKWDRKKNWYERNGYSNRLIISQNQQDGDLDIPMIRDLIMKISDTSMYTKAKIEDMDMNMLETQISATYDPEAVRGREDNIIKFYILKTNLPQEIREVFENLRYADIERKNNEFVVTFVLSNKKGRSFNPMPDRIKHVLKVVGNNQKNDVISHLNKELCRGSKRLLTVPTTSYFTKIDDWIKWCIKVPSFEELEAKLVNSRRKQASCNQSEVLSSENVFSETSTPAPEVLVCRQVHECGCPPELYKKLVNVFGRTTLNVEDLKDLRVLSNYDSERFALAPLIEQIEKYGDSQIMPRGPEPR